MSSPKPVTQTTMKMMPKTKQHCPFQISDYFAMILLFTMITLLTNKILDNVKRHSEGEEGEKFTKSGFPWINKDFFTYYGKEVLQYFLVVAVIFISVGAGAIPIYTSSDTLDVGAINLGIIWSIILNILISKNNIWDW